ncbi:hypothetical protein ACLOJK_027042 [Asimina triloba]
MISPQQPKVATKEPSSAVATKEPSSAVAVAVAVAVSVSVAVSSYISVLISSSPISVVIFSSSFVVVFSSSFDRRFLLSSPSSSSSFVLCSLQTLLLLRLVSSPLPALSNVSSPSAVSLPALSNISSPSAVSYYRLLSQRCLLLSPSPLPSIPRSKHPIAAISSVLLLPSPFSTLPAGLQLFLVNCLPPLQASNTIATALREGS